MRRKKREEAESDFELNIASIIDCFTVLIAYLLLSASFITLGILDVTVAAHSLDQPNDQTPPPELNLTIGVLKNNAIKVTLSGKEKAQFDLSNIQGKLDKSGLTDRIKKIKEKNPTLDAAMVTAEEETKYSNVVDTIQEISKTLSKVALGADNEMIARSDAQ